MAQQVALTPKTAFLQKYVVPNKTVVVSDEDKDFWKSQNIELNVGEIPDCEVVIYGEWLQKVDDPVKMLKEAKASKIVITVPNEWSWPPEYKPHMNAAHKQQYDTELLARHLEEAGWLYVIRLIEFSGWSFLGAEASRAS